VHGIRGLMFLLLLASPGVATAQSFELYGSGGPIMTDAGTSFAAGVGFGLTPFTTMLISVDRTNIASRIDNTPPVFSAFRGGTLLLVTGELRYAPLGRKRFGPYGLAGYGIGASQPNVNNVFRDRVSSTAVGVFFGGGLTVPINSQSTFFADARMIIGGAAREDDFFAAAPIRAGVAWFF
jgi:hypothetical protein